MLTGNKGEWSEVYTLLKILSDKQLHTGDGNLNKIENLIFPVIKILRDESDGTHEFSYKNDIVVIKNDLEEFRIPVAVFQQQAVNLLSKIKESQNRAFSIPEIESFIKSFNSKSLKASSSAKSDIRIIIHDQRTGATPELGFSIKSQLGSASTLLNAGKTTNFIYKIVGDSIPKDIENKINSINTRSKIKDRIENIYLESCKLEFHSLHNPTFENNLILIDSSLPKILSELLLKYNTLASSKISELTGYLTEENPLNFNVESSHPYYEYKIKRFLTDIALGMMPSQVWTGKLDATGGYLVVKEDGDILCYHIYNRNEFENYLLNNTKLETASSSRHKFGEIYKVNGDFFFNLNLQIRFLK